MLPLLSHLSGWLLASGSHPCVIDVFSIVLVSRPPAAGGCLEDHQLWGLTVSPQSSVLSGARPQPVW